MITHGYNRKHTAVPRLDPSTIRLDRKEYERSKESLNERKLTPEELAEVIAKYGPPVMPLDNRKGMPFKKKKGGGAA